MKPPFTTALLAITIMTLLALLCGSCKQKGCTDKNALNYNSAVNEDDGSCVYCHTESIFEGNQSYNSKDYNTSSQYYNMNVVKFTYTNYYISFNIKQCGSDFCKTSVIIQNLTSKTINFSCEFNLVPTQIVTTHNNITISPNESINFGVIFSILSTSICGAPQVEAFILGTFSYH